MKRSAIKRGSSKLIRKTIKNKTFDEKTDHKKLEELLDRLIFNFVLVRDKVCVQCGSNEQLTSGHVFSRRVRLLRWSDRNVHLQCWPCNFAHENNRQPYYECAKRILGIEEFNRLQREWNSQVKLYTEDLLEIKKRLEGELLCLVQNE